jgi:hypothetical protein
MASIFESGKLRLSPEEVGSYRAAADRLHESCQMTLDLRTPITIEEWLFLRLADAALRGDFSIMDAIIAQVQNEIRHRKERQ